MASADDKSSTPPTMRFFSVFSHMKWEQLAAGLSGGVVSTLVLHPLDLVKVRFQVNEGIGVAKRPQYTGMLNALTSIARQQGLRGLYQGVTPNVWGAGASWGLYFFWYDALKMRSRKGEASTQLDPSQHMLCAAQAGLFTLIFTNPLWVAKTRLCLQYNDYSPRTSSLPHATSPPSTVISHSAVPGQVEIRHYRGMVHCLTSTYQLEGVRGLYKGFIPGVFGVSHGALQFMAYEELKTRYNTYKQVPVNTKFSTLEYLSFAALSKIFAATATYPYQVVRARLQDQHRSYNGALDVIRQTYWNEGVRGFFKGIVPGVLRVTPACCITFLVYEKTIEILLRHSALTSASLETTGCDGADKKK